MIAVSIIYAFAIGVFLGAGMTLAIIWFYHIMGVLPLRK